MTLYLPLLFPAFMLGWVFKLVVTAQKDFACNRVVRLKTAIFHEPFMSNLFGFNPNMCTNHVTAHHLHKTYFKDRGMYLGIVTM
jgi:hypothetical protein